MKLFALSVLFKGADNKVICLAEAQELQSFGYFQRSRYNIVHNIIIGLHDAYMLFVIKLLVKKTLHNCAGAARNLVQFSLLYNILVYRKSEKYYGQKYINSCSRTVFL